MVSTFVYKSTLPASDLDVYLFDQLHIALVARSRPCHGFYDLVRLILHRLPVGLERLFDLPLVLCKALVLGRKGRLKGGEGFSGESFLECRTRGRFFLMSM